MDYMAAAALGTALAADAAAVSVSCAVNSGSHQKIRPGIGTALTFALFQAVMPILGWSIGKVGNGIFAAANHIIAFVILLFLGSKMLWDARSAECQMKSSDIRYGMKEVLILAVATSIDALASGIAIPVSVGAHTAFEILMTSVIIGGITLVLSLLGYLLGMKMKNINVHYALIAGGLILVVMAMKTLFAVV